MSTDIRKRQTKINLEGDIDLRDLTAENLRILYGNACHEVRGRGEKRVVTYRLGFVTEIGNIEKRCLNGLPSRMVRRWSKLTAGTRAAKAAIVAGMLSMT